MPSGALTRFLKQGLARDMCPLCRVAQKFEREYIWYFFDEYSSQEWALAEVRGAGGFCAEHADALRRVEVEALKSTLGISQVYLDTLEGVGRDLERLGSGIGRRPALCPACAYRDEGVAKNARYLLDELAESEHSREQFTHSLGLCLPHFDLVWAETRRPDERELILAVELRAVNALVAALREHIRKQGDEAKHERPGPEADAWRHAIYLTSGWPADEGERLETVVGRAAQGDTDP